MKIKILSFLILFFVFLYPIPYPLYPTFAQTCGSGVSQANGLISAPSISGQFPTTGGCIINPKAAFAPFKIPGYDDMKSLYYTQKNPASVNKVPVSDSATQANLNATQDSVYLISGDLNLTGNLTASGMQVVFVDGKLNIGPIIGNQFTYGSSAAGNAVVFIVQGDVNIDSTISKIDAVIISAGNIYTASTVSGGTAITCASNSVTTAPALIINGSLISINPDTVSSSSHIIFCRDLQGLNSTTAAETINNQPKYLVLLRNLLSDTLQKWTEVGPEVVVPIPAQSDFTLTNGGDKTVISGSSVDQTINLTLNAGPQQSVLFTASGLPSGVTASFNPISCSSNCATTMTITALSNTPSSVNTVTVTSTSGTITKDTSFSLTVNNFNFSIGSIPARTLTQASSVTQSINLTLTSGTTVPVTLSASGLPTGVSTSFSNNPCSPTCSSTLNLTASETAQTGPSTVTITGTGGGISKTAPLSLTVNACTRQTWYRDNDGDNYGSSTYGTALACTQPSGYVATSSDCNDQYSTINPAAAFQTSPRPDNGSWDWDCSGGIELEYGAYNTGGCVIANSSYDYSDPSCTQSISWSGYYMNLSNSSQCGSLLGAISPGLAQSSSSSPYWIYTPAWNGTPASCDSGGSAVISNNCNVLSNYILGCR
ncbi:MAG: hypothetical protein AAB414_05575 [Patescibacteria group bacterium]